MVLISEDDIVVLKVSFLPKFDAFTTTYLSTAFKKIIVSKVANCLDKR